MFCNNSLRIIEEYDFSFILLTVLNYYLVLSYRANRDPKKFVLRRGTSKSNAENYGKVISE